MLLHHNLHGLADLDQIAHSSLQGKDRVNTTLARDCTLSRREWALSTATRPCMHEYALTELTSVVVISDPLTKAA